VGRAGGALLAVTDRAGSLDRVIEPDQEVDMIGRLGTTFAVALVLAACALVYGLQEVHHSS
jgi:hypothetical protein